DSLECWLRAVRAIRDQDWMSDPGPGLSSVAREIRRVIATLPDAQLGVGAPYMTHHGRPTALGNWYRHNAAGLTHHESRAHMRSDLHRYMFAAVFGNVHSRSPELQNFPRELRPAHGNIARALDGGDMFNDRFRV